MTETLWSPAGVVPQAVPPSTTPNLKAVQALLVLGGLPPGLGPFGPCKASKSAEVLRATALALSAAPTPGAESGHVRREATALLDAELGRALAGGRSPLVLFSGGVDSSLMVARLLELGRDDVQLLHYEFRVGDPESAVARRIAENLGVRMTVVRRSPGSEINCLLAPGRTWPVPFGDQSAAPTAELCAAVAEYFDPAHVVVFDGTGADGAFGLGDRALTIESMRRRVPPLVLGMGSGLYRRGLWRLRGRVEHRGRAVRRLATFEPGFAAIAQNSLFGILYDAPDIGSIEARWRRDMSEVGATSVAHEVVLTDLAITCAAIFAQKTYGPLTGAGFEVSYPFLTPSLAALGIAHTAAYPTAQPKAWMKDQLMRHIDADLVYRPKSGFIDPARELFDNPEFRDALRDAVAVDGVAHDLLRLEPIKDILRGNPSLTQLPHGHLNVLWTLAFVDRWYRTSAQHHLHLEKTQ